MSEYNSGALIRLPIDQELFMELVRAGDTIDDATVATEVVSFERVGDAYVLEGAIVFAGYMEREDEVDESSGRFSVGTEDDEYVQHVHHRMPFVLRVPISAQPRGLVNVKSRISSWSLHVIREKWLRVVAELQINGLNGSRGYHFECGTQELGDVLFNEVVPVVEQSSQPETKVPSQSAVEQDELVGVELASASDDVTLNDHVANADQNESDRNFSGIDFVQGVTETFSEARSGHGWKNEQENTLELDEATRSASKELAELDRFFQTNPVSAEERPVADATRTPLVQQTNTRSPEPSVAQFEFEHQLSTEELSLPVEAQEPQRAFVASRSFTEDGFRPTDGFAALRQDAVRHEAPPASADALQIVQDEPVSTIPSHTETTGLSHDLWSFVDFNAPDRLQTLRFVIVMEEETLESVADRVGCTRSELIRVNKLETESVTPGQCLQIPSVPFTLNR